MDVRLPDGTILRGVPDGTTKADIAAKLKANGRDVPAEWMGAAPAATPKDPEGFAPALGRAVLNAGAGAIRGAGSIGATLLAPMDALNSAMTGQGASLKSNNARRDDMTAALGSMGADTGSLAFGAGKLGGEIAGTLGVGGAVAGVAGRALPAGAAPLLDAIRTAGMSSGGVKGAAGVGLRAAGGGITGATSAGLVNPDEAGQGALIGAALPGVLQGAGWLGSKVAQSARNVTASGQAKGGAEIAKALDLRTQAEIDAAIAKLRSAREMVPGSKPTAAQALRTPQAGIVQRVVSDGAGGRALRDQMDAQNVARLAALESVAPTNPNGLRSAQQDLGETVGRFAQAGDAAAKARTRALYESVPQDEATLYLPELGGIRDKYFGRGSFTPRAAVDNAVRTAQDIGSVEAAGLTAGRSGPPPMTLAQAVRKAGGISINNNDGLRGELVGLRGDVKNLIRSNGGLTPGRMAEKMREAGYLADEDSATLLAALRDDATGLPQFSMQDDLSRQWGAMRDAGMGDAPGAARVPQKVTLREFDNLRKSIGSSARGAAKDSERATEAAALGDMRTALDDRINEVVRGDGAIDENLPIAWANALDAARKSKIDQVQQFRTGPQAAMFRKGSDGLPSVQGGEIAAKFWGSRPGVADDVKSFKRLIGDKPELLGQFRSMVTTEGAGTATQAGNLTGKFVKWVENTLPGLKEGFDPAQVKTLQRIAADIKRAEMAAGAGMSRGSNTYQNAQNALNLGLLDNPLLNAAANRVPIVNNVSGPALSWMRDTAREAKGRRLAELLADSGATANALQAAGQRPPPGAVGNMLANPELRALILRGAPVVSADR